MNKGSFRQYFTVELDSFCENHENSPEIMKKETGKASKFVEIFDGMKSIGFDIHIGLYARPMCILLYILS